MIQYNCYQLAKLTARHTAQSQGHLCPSSVLHRGQGSSGSTGYSLTTRLCPKVTESASQGPEEPASEGNAPGAEVGYFCDLQPSKRKK